MVESVSAELSWHSKGGAAAAAAAAAGAAFKPVSHRLSNGPVCVCVACRHLWITSGTTDDDGFPMHGSLARSLARFMSTPRTAAPIRSPRDGAETEADPGVAAVGRAGLTAALDPRFGTPTATRMSQTRPRLVLTWAV